MQLVKKQAWSLCRAFFIKKDDVDKIQAATPCN